MRCKIARSIRTARFPEFTLASDLHGNTYVVWIRTDFDEETCWVEGVNHFANGKFGQTQRIASFLNKQKMEVQAGFDGKNDLLIVFQYAGNQIGSAIQLEGNDFKPFRKITANSSGEAHELKLAVSSSQDACAVWENSNEDSAWVEGINYPVLGEFSHAKQLSTRESQFAFHDLQLTIDNAGNAFVAWTREDENADIWVEGIFPLFGNDSVIPLSTAPSRGSCCLQLVKTSQDDIVVGWVRVDYTFGFCWVESIICHPASERVETVRELVSFPIGESIGPNELRLIEKKDNFFLVWDRKDSGYKESGRLWLEGAVFSSSKSTDLIKIHRQQPYFGREIWFAKLVCGPHKNAFVAWQREAVDGEYWIEGAFLHPANGFGETIQLAANHGKDMDELEMVSDDRGNIVVVWIRKDIDCKTWVEGSFCLAGKEFMPIDFDSPIPGKSIQDLELNINQEGNILIAWSRESFDGHWHIELATAKLPDTPGSRHCL